ncbi:hypothetical protein QFZ79_000537 [Arthrobacter sp. V4I6]|uniref:hypothetical protein n=1 Tax=unclassified Arthrobacter TaxID=235627 RepID=UPI0027888409|nr:MULTISPECIES: hypothetical protein [unclassified Arthrobacter]MDQ0822797.1 hypothetical protein [Arthrobacter sp. V1I7]MDQ0852426.1 hypothetical protein [Arthrobacter sp. V4I6]
MTITAKAYTHIPGFDDHTKAEKRINEESTRNRAIKPEALISTTDYVEAALAGEDFPKEPHFHNEEIRSERQNAAVCAQMLKDALKAVQERKRDLIRDNSDSALGFLRAELAKLMDDVRANDEVLGTIRAAEQVLAANDPKILSAWGAREELISRYSEIRTVQHGLTAPGLAQGEPFKIAVVGHIRNSLELSDYWLSKRERSTSHRAANDQLEGVRNFDTWLGAGGSALFKHSTSAIPSTDINGKPANPWDYLVWLATVAEPWVPSTAQVVSAYDAANLAVAETDYKKFRVQEAARGRYFEVIGLAPVVAYSNTPKKDGDDKLEVGRMKRSSWGEAGARAMGF